MRSLLTAASCLIACTALGPAAHGQPDPAAQADYSGTKVVRVGLHTARDFMLMTQLARDCWTHTPRLGASADFLVSQSALDHLRTLAVPFVIVADDVQSLINDERARLAQPFQGRSWYDEYKNYADLRSYLDSLVALRPDLATPFQVGLSLEGRSIFAVRIDSPTPGPAGSLKPVIFIHATQHAREWLAPMTATYIADQLVRGYGTDAAATAMLDRYSFVVVPLVNPDGYVYTWTTDRFWRKNRRNNGNDIFGVDLNRNWSFAWGSDNGSSGNTASQTYRGAAPFSEPESSALRDAIQATPGVAAVFDIHTYGQWLLAPWGYTNQLPQGHDAFNLYGKQMQSAILASTGRNYRYGPTYTLLYPVSGGVIDWWFGTRDVPGWTIELRGEGFAPPPTDIQPAAIEGFTAVRTLAQGLCRADINRDGFTTGDDFDQFVAAFLEGVPAADFDRDGFTSGLDFDAFVQLFEQGC